MRRGILAAQGCRIRDVQWLRCRAKPIAVHPSRSAFRRRVRGQLIESIMRVGKRVVLVLENEDRIVVEPRMTGLLLVTDPPSPQHLRLGLELDDGPWDTIWYWDRRGLGHVRLYSADEFAAALGPQAVGPDALTIDADQLRARLRASRREVKVALLDQRAIAGIGNLYAAEILHQAGVHPRARCHRLSVTQWNRIADSITDVLQTAITYEGSTLSDGTYRNALNKSGGYQNEHRVYAREDQLCPTCRDDKIMRIVQSQRSTFFCPTCQSR